MCKKKQEMEQKGKYTEKESMLEVKCGGGTSILNRSRVMCTLWKLEEVAQKVKGTKTVTAVNNNNK